MLKISASSKWTNDTHSIYSNNWHWFAYVQGHLLIVEFSILIHYLLVLERSKGRNSNTVLLFHLLNRLDEFAIKSTVLFIF